MKTTRRAIIGAAAVAMPLKVKVLEGEMPAKGSDVSVFIDIIGMPLTPLSLAGARRRA
jgi:hypothetical protein